MHISRRALARVALAGAASIQQAVPQAAASDELEQARKEVASSSQALLEYEVAMAAEPAFQFKA